MARPLSEEKRNALLQAAAQAVAAEGLTATTSRISRLAGVAEGTLFTYFENKDRLLNELYVHLKAGLREAMVTDFPHAASAGEQARHAWNGYIGWGLAQPDSHRALQQLIVSDRIDAAHRAAGAEGFAPLEAMLRSHLAPGDALAPAGALEFAGALFTAMAQTVMDFIARQPEAAEAYRDRGFRAFWAALHAGTD
ncbi:MAG: TetR family transcriptional regulator [Roseateles depolymerans]|uniref:TetR family transcriptional regulator n=1 Tax=Roseateles depolymerans TaxID=76731 RepID=A0A2W5FTP7_9BURK|nr:MAG: TetR family transcriptional regulator [Roseateles depolymerans]